MSKGFAIVLMLLCGTTIGVEVLLAVVNASRHHWFWFVLNVVAAGIATVAIFYVIRAIVLTTRARSATSARPQ